MTFAKFAIYLLIIRMGNVFLQSTMLSEIYNEEALNIRCHNNISSIPADAFASIPSL